MSIELLKETVKDLENISLIERSLSPLDNIEDDMICESLGYGEVKSEIKRMQSKQDVTDPYKDPDISKEMALLQKWAEKQKQSKEKLRRNYK